MKKLLLSALAFSTVFASNAQVDTLTTHFGGTPTIYTDGSGGYVGGNNSYGDLAKMQLFDAGYGVTSGGTVTSVLLLAPIKVANGGNFQVAIWGDNAGQPANILSPLGIANVTLASVDTSAAAYAVANNSVVYNVAVNFPTAINIPAGNKFWAGIVLPTTNGDTITLATTTDGDFTDASTHTGEIQSAGTYYSFNDGTTATWGLDVALGIFPVVNLVASVEENVIASSVYPNPANDELNIQVGNEVIETVSVITLDGKTVMNATSGTLNVSELTAGMYMYNVTTKAGKLAKGNFVKK